MGVHTPHRKGRTIGLPPGNKRSVESSYLSVMMTDSGAGVEWGGRSEQDDQPERDARGWPILHPACDSVNPVNRHGCVLGHHAGQHRDDTGAEWLDD